MEEAEDRALNISHRYVRRGAVQTRIVEWTAPGLPRVVFVPGWLSTDYTWRYFIPQLARKFQVSYFESREKPATVFDGSLPDQSCSEHVADLAGFLDSINSDYCVVASSIGATTYLKALPHLKAPPIAQVLLSPNLKAPKPRVNFLLTPLYGVLLRLPIWVLMAVRPPILWFIEKTSFNRDAHQVAGMLRALSSARLPLATESARRLDGFCLEPEDLRSISLPTLVIAATRDDVHDATDSDVITKILPHCERRYYRTFADTHGSQAAKEVTRWLEERYD
ncbi:MAG: alpha/beta hydrolase [Acidobacteriota bacterium]|nr:alpha/beta hydrolase [Acidobacteriota bacterium]